MITIYDIQKFSEIVNLTKLAKAADIPFARLYAKVRRGSDLTTSESAAIEKALAAVGLMKES